jgi:hypothetical protein
MTCAECRRSVRASKDRVATVACDQRRELAATDNVALETENLDVGADLNATNLNVVDSSAADANAVNANAADNAAAADNSANAQ